MSQIELIARMTGPPSLRTWIRRYRYQHGHHAARTFHELDPTTGNWRRL